VLRTNSPTAFRLLPHPIADLCTPFVPGPRPDEYTRVLTVGRKSRRVRVWRERGDGSPQVRGCHPDDLFGRRRPSRSKVMNYSRKQAANPQFLAFVERTVVLPAFPLSVEEAFVKTVIRQIVPVTVARRQFSQFTKAFGTWQDGCYSFPDAAEFGASCHDALVGLGLGLKCERLLAGLAAIADGDLDRLYSLKGVGPWSARVLRVELERDYAYYPFGDKSGEAVARVCGVDPQAAAQRSAALAADVYIYGVAFLEYTRWQQSTLPTR